MYRSVQPGDAVCLVLREGALGNPLVYGANPPPGWGRGATRFHAVQVAVGNDYQAQPVTMV